MWRLEAVEAFDEWFPQWRSVIGGSSRDGWAVGWLDLTTPLAGVLLADFADDEDSKEAEALSWQENQTYFLLRPPRAATRRCGRGRCPETRRATPWRRSCLPPH